VLLNSVLKKFGKQWGGGVTKPLCKKGQVVFEELLARFHLLEDRVKARTHKQEARVSEQ